MATPDPGHRRAQGKVAATPATLADQCAQAIMETLPPVMRAIREEVRRQGALHFSIPQLRTLAYLHRSRGPACSNWRITLESRAPPHPISGGAFGPTKHADSSRTPSGTPAGCPDPHTPGRSTFPAGAPSRPSVDGNRPCWTLSNHARTHHGRDEFTRQDVQGGRERQRVSVRCRVGSA